MTGKLMLPFRLSTRLLLSFLLTSSVSVVPTKTNAVPWSLSLTFFNNSNAQESSASSIPSTEEQAFCGDRPSDEAKAKKEANKLEQEMPPVQNQSKTGWCHVATGVALLDYHNMKNQLPPSLDSQKFYSNPKNMVSFIDFKASVESFYVENTPSNSSKPVTVDVDLSKGGFAYFGLLQIQRKDQILRSQAQLPFEPNNENSSSIPAQEALINYYKTTPLPSSPDVSTLNKSQCPLQTCNATAPQKQMRSFRLFNLAVFNWIQEYGQSDHSKIADY